MPTEGVLASVTEEDVRESGPTVVPLRDVYAGQDVAPVDWVGRRRDVVASSSSGRMI